MALGETARLIASLELDARKFQKSLKAADASLSKTEGRAYHAGQQIGTGVKNGLKIAAAGVGFIAANVALGVDSLIELEKQTAQTNAVIKSTGGAAKISAAEVGKLADKYESLNATIGDEVIRSAENMLLTFTNVKDKAFEPALAAILDLNTALGKGPEGLTKTTIQVGKALNDPIKGISALQKVGVSFTAQQKDQIAKLLSLTKGEEKHYLALRKSNKAAAERYKASRIASRQDDAQRIILKELNKEFGGSFLAQGNTTAGKVAKFTDSIDDLQRALAEALLPAIGNVADELTKLLQDPATVSGIKHLGEDIGKLFSKGNIRAAAKVVGDTIAAIRDAAPTIKTTLGVAADLIGNVVSAFQKLPPDVQKLAVGALLAEKATGGLISNIVGGLAGAFKNMITASMSVQAASVVVNGGGGGVPGAPGGGGGTPKNLPGVTVPAIGAGAVLDPEILRVINAGWEDVKKIKDDAHKALSNNDRDAQHNEQMQARQIQAAEALKTQSAQAAREEHGRGERLILTGQQTKTAIDASKVRLAAAAAETARETARGAQATAAAARAGGERAAQAIRDKKLSTSVKVMVNNNISIRDQQRKLSFAQSMRIYG